SPSFTVTCGGESCQPSARDPLARGPRPPWRAGGGCSPHETQHSSARFVGASCSAGAGRAQTRKPHKNEGQPPGRSQRKSAAGKKFAQEQVRRQVDADGQKEHQAEEKARRGQPFRRLLAAEAEDPV